MALSGWALLSSPLWSAPEYLLTDLGPGAAWAINNHGVAVGDGPGAAFLHDGQSRTNLVFDWWYGPSNPDFTDRSTAATAHGINDHGVITGTFTVWPRLEHVYRWEGSGRAAAFYPYPTASSVNSAGHVIGGSTLFLPDWTVVALNATGLDLNDGGTVVGQDSEFRAVVRPPGGVFERLDLGGLAPPGSVSSASTINSAGQIAGVVESIASNGYGTYRLFVWSGGVVTEIGRSDTAHLTRAGAWGINNVGVVVGRIVATGDVPHAFRWKGGRLDDLNTLVEAEGWTLSEARDINDDGVIVGSGQRNGELRAFRLDPIDPDNPIPPFVVTQPQGGQFGLGESTTLTVTATGTAPLEFQWQRNQQDLTGQTNAALVLSSMDAGASGEYRVRIRNVAGESYSHSAAVTVLDPEVQIVLMSGLWIHGAVAGQYEVQQQVTPSLGITNWTAIATVTLTQSPQLWIDLATATNSSPRFYRAVRLLP